MRQELIERARIFRKTPTRSEALMWEALRAKSLGVRFRRQWVAGPFIVDFVCLERQLIIEIDGPVHATQEEHDRERQGYLEALGYRFFRVTSSEVECDLASILNRLRLALEAPFDPPSPE